MNTQTDGVKRAEKDVRPEVGLAPTKSKWGGVRRWLGIYNRQEKEVINYSRRVKEETIAIATRQKILSSRPSWMRHEDYKKLRTLQLKIERKKR